VKTTLACAAALLISSAPSAAWAQDAGRADPKVARTADVLTATTSPASGSAAQFAPVLSLEGTAKDKIVTAQVGFAYRSVVLTAGLSGAVDSSGDPTELADLNGLRDKTTASMHLAWHTWAQDSGLGGLSNACARYRDLVKNAGPDLGADCGYLILKRATDAAVRQRVMSESERSSIMRMIPIKPLFYVEGGGKLAPETFNFVSATDLTPGREQHTSWSVDGSAGVLFGSGWLVAGGLAREVAFQGGGSVQICQPLGSTSALRCGQKTVGPPGAVERTNQVSAELRKYFGPNFAMSPRIVYDKKKNAVAVNAPLYFVKSVDGGLDGGVTFGWRSDTRAFTVTAFVGAVLGLITN
jgi:hypothetical protein